MLIYPVLLGLSLVGIFFLTRPHYKEAKNIPDTELRLRLRATESVRMKIWKNMLQPVFITIREASLPGILKSVEYIVKNATGFVEKLEKKLKNVADAIHGKAINLEVSKKTEYWQNVGEAKGNVPKMDSAHSVIKEEGKISDEVPKMTSKPARGRPKRIILK